MEKDIKNESTKPYELLAAMFDTTPEEIQEKANNQTKNQELSEDLAKALSGLSPLERDLLRLRFGMDDGRKRTLEEVGNLFGVTAKEIRQVEMNALKKLKKSATENI